MMNSGDVGRVGTSSLLVLIFSILSWFGSLGGFIIGFILALIGSIMGLAWHPRDQVYAPQLGYFLQLTGLLNSRYDESVPNVAESLRKT